MCHFHPCCLPHGDYCSAVSWHLRLMRRLQSARIVLSLWFAFSLWMFFLSLTRKFKNLARFCFSVLYSLLFILKHSEPFPSISLSFHVRDFPQFIIEYFPCSTGTFLVFRCASSSYIGLLLFLYQSCQLASNCFISPFFSLCDLLRFRPCNTDLVVVGVLLACAKK